jgi:prevent-host-death family protein
MSSDSVLAGWFTGEILPPTIHAATAAGAAASRFGLARLLYRLYICAMTIARKGVQEAREQLPALLAEAEKGRTTLITRHGRPIAAIVPAAAAKPRAQKPLLPLAGSGKGFWGKDSTKMLRRLRDEWER